MRSLRKLVVLGATMAAALAVTAPSASAIEVVNEATGAHCSAVAAASHGTGSGGCLLRAVSSGQVELGGPFSMILCNNTFEARVNEAGAGYIYSQVLTNCSPSVVTPCSEAAGNDTWPVNAASETTMNATFCVNVPVFGAVNCTLNGLTITESPAHRYTITTGAAHKSCTNPFFSVQGTWTQVVDAAHPAVELRD